MWQLNQKNILMLLAVFIISFVLFRTIFPDQNWSLMVCKSRLGVECQENSYVIPGYKSQKECMTAGMTLAKDEGFECGKDCRSEGSLSVCSPICNANGCID